jgi:hypothetical protein
VESATFISDKNRTQSGIWAVGYEIVGNHYLNEAANAAAEGDTDFIYKAAEMRLRTGGVNNEAGRKANYFGAMLFTDKPYDVAMTLSANKTVLSSAGDEIVVTANVQTDSSIKRVNWDIPESLKPYIDYEIISDTMLKLKLKEMPDVDGAVGVIKATSVKKATVSDTITIMIDKTPPVITVTGLEYGTYSNSEDITPILTISDSLSGVDSSKTTITISTDGEIQAVQQGAAIPLYTLPLGWHTLTVTASDLAGNTSSVTVSFQTTATVQSLQALVTRFADAGWIDNAGIANSLQNKLAKNNLEAFVNEVQAQSGKHIPEQAAGFLLRDAQYLLSNS